MITSKILNVVNKGFNVAFEVSVCPYVARTNLRGEAFMLMDIRGAAIKFPD